MQRLKTRLTKVIASGFIQVFFANIVSYLVAFCGSIIYVRLMGAHEFGIYTFSYNIISFFLLVNGFGAASGVLQFVSRTENKPLGLAYLKFSMRLGIVFNCFLSLVILIYAFWVDLPIAGSRTALIAMAFFPVGRLYIDVYQAYLRATQQNQLLAKFAISTSLILLLANILGIVYGALIGFIASTYISYGIIILLASLIFKLPNLWRIQSLTIDKKEFISYSIYATFGNAFAQLVYILDILILGYLVKDAVLVTTYKVATIIPFALNFIPGVISTFFSPYFARHADNLAYIRQL
ncbi:MAG: oligosaccharide flippase family protein, partial [Burkholderiales bacterium]